MNAALECCDLVPGLHMAMPTQDAAVVILAELKRLRDRLEKIEVRSRPNREQRYDDPQTVLDSIYRHAFAALNHSERDLLSGDIRGTTE